MRPSDETLVDGCLRGDAAAYDRLVGRHQKKIFNVALRMLNDVEGARDVAQCVFLKAYEKLDRFDCRLSFGAWIYRIAINECIDMLNARRRFESVDDGMASSARSPAECAYGNELSATVRRALMALRDDLRSVVILRHYLGCSYRAMAGILEIPEKTVKSRLYTARQQLREALSLEGVSLP